MTTVLFCGNSWPAGRWNWKQSRRLWSRVLYKYGDDGVKSIADLMKSEVFLLGSYLKVQVSDCITN
jgi:hypothetical protein